MFDLKFAAIDLETTGKYPLSSEICELAVIVFSSDGAILDRFEATVKPKGEMSPESERVHGMSLESLKDSPELDEVLPSFLSITQGCSMVGHNLQFDLGFLANELDRFKEGEWWSEAQFSQDNFCTSLLSIGLNPNFKSHRLAHLAEHYKLHSSPNHRAMQDAQTCMEVFLKLLEKANHQKAELLSAQGSPLGFKDFSVRSLSKVRPELEPMVESCKASEVFELKYSKGSKKNKWRPLCPHGLVLRSIGDSFLVATDPGEVQTKRFLLGKTLETRTRPQTS